MKKSYRAYIVALLSVPVLLYGSTKNEPDYEFYVDDSCYSFRGSFIVKAELDCLISVVYDFEHISKYASGAKSIELVRQAENWSVVTYTYRRFIIFKNKSTWRRTLNRENHEVVFLMISSENNINIMPDLLSSSGYYQIRLEEECYRVEYFQECKLVPGFLKDSYINKVKKEAIEFLLEFREYVEKTCV